MFKSIKNSDGHWVVENKAGAVVELCNTRAEARRRASELTREALAEPTDAMLAVDTDTLPVDSDALTVEAAATEAEISEASADVAVDTADIAVNLESNEPAEEPNNMADVLAALKQFEQLAQPAEQTTTTVKVVKVEKRVTKASQVRARIAIAKQNAEAPDVVVKWTIDNLGMAKGLAKAYVDGNWGKVPG